jgi:plasmid stabilization system protein ParE
VATAPLEILPAAVEAALEAARWYRERSPKAALAFHVQIRAALDRIQNKPQAWMRHHHGTRRLLLGRFPYEVVYRTSRAWS